MLAADPESPKDIVLVVDGQAAIRTQWFSETQSKTPVFAWTPDFLSTFTTGVAVCGTTLFAFDESDSVVGLSTYSEKTLLKVRSIPDSMTRTLVRERRPMVAWRDCGFLAMEHLLVGFLGNGQTTLQTFCEPIAGRPQRILGIATSGPQSRPRLVLSFEQGCILYWPNSNERVVFATDLVCPVAGFTRGDFVIAADATHIEVSEVREGSAWQLKTLPRRGAAPIAVLTLIHRNRFALCTADGSIQIYEVRI